VLDQLAMVILTISDVHDFMLDDKKTLGILDDGGYEEFGQKDQSNGGLVKYSNHK